MIRRSVAALCLLAAAGPLAGAQAPAASPTPALKDLFEGAFLVGAALSPRQFSGRDPAAAGFVRRQFNAIAPENVLKWEVVHPRPDRYDFTASDRYVAFGRRNGMFVLGHNLVWHSQTPAWVFRDAAGRPLGRDALLARMRAHINRVVGRYRGRIGGWDVVNEALNEDGTMRESPWLRIIGPDYIAKAFEYAHEADPGAELYYNDYNVEEPLKLAGAVRLVKDLQARGIHVAAVGVQAHHKLGWPSFEAEDSTIATLAALGIHVNVSELDIDVLPPATRNRTADVALHAQGDASTNPYVAELPDSVQTRLAQRYAGMFAVYLKHRDVIDRVTFWGVNDGDSWLNNWPVRGRTSHPLLFDRRFQPKPAFDSVAALARRSRDTLSASR
jgi:endo-1,4-beta-xylanase